MLLYSCWALQLWRRLNHYCIKPQLYMLVAICDFVFVLFIVHVLVVLIVLDYILRRAAYVRHTPRWLYAVVMLYHVRWEYTVGCDVCIQHAYSNYCLLLQTQELQVYRLCCSMSQTAYILWYIVSWLWLSSDFYTCMCMLCIVFFNKKCWGRYWTAAILIDTNNYWCGDAHVALSPLCQGHQSSSMWWWYDHVCTSWCLIMPVSMFRAAWSSIQDNLLLLICHKFVILRVIPCGMQLDVCDYDSIASIPNDGNLKFIIRNTGKWSAKVREAAQHNLITSAVMEVCIQLICLMHRVHMASSTSH